MAREWEKQLQAEPYRIKIPGGLNRLEKNQSEFDMSKAILLGMSVVKGKVHCKSCGKFVTGFVQVDGGYACDIKCAMRALEKRGLI